ncbi:MAG TPA: radical SAM protein, partial [Candidatus Hydrogenedentes bacterium]|nr:radical SAM protein [Candidatus Hydrogenedentota bacterium]
LRRNLTIEWSCLSRVDNLDVEMLSWMKKAGCVRVIVGVESYAPGVLEMFGKRIAPETINARLRLIREAGMESLGFIIVGGPFESEADFELTRRGVLASPLDLVIVDTLSIYGGSDLTQRFKQDVEFQLLPYISRWKNPEVERVALQREKTLYRQFYFRPRILLRQMYTIFRYPARSFRLFLLLISFLFSSSQNRERKDLF